MDLLNIFTYKDLRKNYLLFYSFLKEIYQNQPFSLFKHAYLNSVQVKFQMLIARYKAHEHEPK